MAEVIIGVNPGLLSDSADIFCSDIYAFFAVDIYELTTGNASELFLKKTAVF